jgi:isoleucyl-tRNA synthetase
MESYGADIIRLWALSVDFTEDHRIGDEILKGVSDQYRKLRNTFRYLLGALDGFTDEERVTDTNAMPELERYVLHLLAQIDAQLRQAVDDYDFNTYVRVLCDFANNDLSAFFFDIRKDSLYCDVGSALPLGTEKRKAYRTVLDTLFHAMIRWAAPVIVFTAEEVWQTRYPDANNSVHFLEWPELPLTRHASEGWHLPADADPSLRWGDELVEKWNEIRSLRRKVTEAIEPLRRDKTLGSSLEAVVTIPDSEMPDHQWDNIAEDPEIFICGQIAVDFNSHDIAVTKTTHHKCGRCWRHLPEVSEDGDLCGRCDEVVNG